MPNSNKNVCFFSQSWFKDKRMQRISQVKGNIFSFFWIFFHILEDKTLFRGDKNGRRLLPGLHKRDFLLTECD